MTQRLTVMVDDGGCTAVMWSDRNLRDRDLVKMSRPGLHQNSKFPILEIRNRDSTFQNFWILQKNVISKLNFFRISGIFRPILVVSYLQIQQTKNSLN